MFRITRFIILTSSVSINLILLLLVASCASTSGTHVEGIWGTSKGSVMVTSLSATEKEGRASCESFLGFISGDCSIAAAKKNGSITQVSTIDYEATRYWQFYAKYTTIVTGQ
jgi:hypothetical protein